ncbi:predicted protein [Naegleria gruberi]|uniref:Predicted protein n=1 Tax=Naegleria gruberi TaxID=5762 RepID=D2VFX4_NAEGR|nr:uncharacterized protein NAEGRDRAFT_49206 [Naegleria gruberi]EFC44265.1 predicted protein [Naegleria gruberi]|eukprot:XP_002677009.1 predicted protein [Naegleria gruberi strain NEG-M]
MKRKYEEEFPEIIDSPNSITKALKFEQTLVEAPQQAAQEYYINQSEYHDSQIHSQTPPIAASSSFSQFTTIEQHRTHSSEQYLAFQTEEQPQVQTPKANTWFPVHVPDRPQSQQNHKDADEERKLTHEELEELFANCTDQCDSEVQNCIR